MLTGQAPSVSLLSVSALTSFVLIPSRFLCLDLGSKLSSATSSSANPSLPDSRATAEQFRCSQAVDDECLIAQPPSLIKPSLPFDLDLGGSVPYNGEYFGASPQSDYGMITLLATDGVLEAGMVTHGPRDGMIQCFIKRDKSNLTYHLFLCLSPALLVENGKFLLSAKRIRRATCTEYVISMDADHIYRSSSTYIGKLREIVMESALIPTLNIWMMEGRKEEVLATTEKENRLP